MGKVAFDNLVIELTRRCNMQCAHCMRGDAQAKDTSESVLDALLQHTSSISTLTISGGEVALVPEMIRALAKQIRQYHTAVGSLYVVTNGKEVSDEFMMALVDLFLATDLEDELCAVALSQDEFHEVVPNENINKLKMLRFFNEHDKNTDFSRGGLLDLGRARNLSGYPKRQKLTEPLSGEIWQDNELRIESTIACTVDGDILSDCDYEYCSTDSIKLSNVFEDWVTALKNQISKGEVA